MAKQRADALVADGLDAVSPSGVRLASAVIVAAAGIAAVVVPVVRAIGRDGLANPLLGLVAPATFGVAVVVGGYWIAASDLDGTLAVSALVWWFMGTAFGTFAALGLIAYQLAAGLGVADVAVVLSTMASIGGVGGLLVGRYDVQSQRRQRQLVQERQRLADEREKLALLNRIVRHDIGNDLQIVAGMSDHLDGHVDPDGREYLERLRRTTEEAIQLTEQVRTFVASLDDDEPSTLRRVSIQRVLRTQVENAREIYREATVELGDVPDVAVTADELLSTVVHNLLTNAIEHNDRANPYVEVSARRDGASVVIAVADDGPGIPPAERERLRAVEGGPDRSRESGLGLYIMGMLVDRYEGTVAIDDREPRGTVVTVTLPVADGG